MPRIKKPSRLVVQKHPPHNEQPAWAHLKRLLQTSLKDTCSLLQDWMHNRQTDTLHQARVEWRRQKCLLKFYKPLLPEPPQRHSKALQTLWHLTGQLRNLDVAQESTLPAWRQAHPKVAHNEWHALEQQLHQDRLRAHHALAQEIAKPCITAGFKQLHTWMKRLDTVSLKVQRKPFEKWARQRLQRLHKKIRPQRHSFTPERQHQCRILLKQERHALESLLTNHPDKKIRAQLKRIKKKQTVWGHDQDMQTVLKLIEEAGLYPDLAKAFRASM